VGLQVAIGVRVGRWTTTGRRVVSAHGIKRIAQCVPYVSEGFSPQRHPPDS
jgi:putative component of membrane protein insertase Oxa1/YidC/SpoIIIJ protein YidD